MDIEYCLIFSILIYYVKSDTNCLSGLKVEQSSNRSINLSWKYDCLDQVNTVLYKIYYEHKEWKACETSKHDAGRGAGRGNLEVRDATNVEVPNLHPYSVYKVSVKALPNYKVAPRGVTIPEEKEIIAETLEGVPNVRPTHSNVPTRVESTTLKLNWNVAVQSDCEHFNARLDGFHYILQGIEPWNDKYSKHASTSETYKTFQYLMPYSKYILYVYVQTAIGVYNPDLPFKIPAETKQDDKAGIPRDLKVSLTQDGSQYHVTWLPPYPPTGEVSHYVIRWKQANSEVWSGTSQVHPSSDLCSKNLRVDYTKNKYEKRICHTLPTPYGSTNVTYQVAAYNAGSSDPGDFTNSVYPVLEEDANSNIKAMVIGIVVGVVILAVIVVVMAILFSKCSKDSRYKNIPNYVSTSGRGNSLRISGPVALNSHPNGTPNDLPPPWTPPLTRHSSGASHCSNSKYQHLLVPMNSTRRPGSIQETPLPPVPGSDPLYEELPQDKLDAIPSTIRVSFNAVNEKSDEEEGEEFLQPKVIIQDEDGYLRPKALKVSDEGSGDDEEYLKPTFNKFQRIDSRDLSPPHEEPPPIPMQSYVPVPQKKAAEYSNQSSKNENSSSYVPVPAIRKKSNN